MKITAKKAHFSISNSAREYEDEIATLASNNYGPWKDTKQAEEHVKKAIREHARELYNDVIASFNADDIKYIVEAHLYQDETDPYGLDPPDPRVGKLLEKWAETQYGAEWVSRVRISPANKSNLKSAIDENSAWVVTGEGWNYAKVADQIQNFVKKSGLKQALVEPYDHVHIVIYPAGMSAEASVKRTTSPAKTPAKTRRPASKTAKASLDKKTLDQLVEMTAESLDLENSGDAHATNEVVREAKKYGDELSKALLEWVKKHPLTGDEFTSMAPDEQVDELMHAEAEYLVLMTLRGKGVGIWDGDWDHFFADSGEIKPMTVFLKSKLHKFADGTGGGSLEEAFENAAHETCDSEEAESTNLAPLLSSVNARVNREIIATLIKAKYIKLANTVARNPIRVTRL
jgi:hypothetical protein